MNSESKDNFAKKEFWDSIAATNPQGIAHFSQWLEKYKSKIDWQKLFNFGFPRYAELGWHNPDFSDLPTAMQFGIFLQYVSETTPLAFSGSMFSKPSSGNARKIIQAFFRVEIVSIRKEKILQND